MIELRRRTSIHPNKIQHTSMLAIIPTYYAIAFAISFSYSWSRALAVIVGFKRACLPGKEIRYHPIRTGKGKGRRLVVSFCRIMMDSGRNTSFICHTFVCSDVSHLERPCNTYHLAERFPCSFGSERNTYIIYRLAGS